MYDDFDLYETDWVYEQFRENSGHITDFSERQYPIYHKAVAEYKLINPSVKLEVKEGYHPGQGGLYCYSYGDLSEFWQVFERVKANQ